MAALPPTSFVPALRRLSAVAALAFLAPALVAAAQQRGVSIVNDPSGTSAASSGHYYALVIGINQYAAPMPRLKTAVNDARAIAQTLADLYGFQVTLLVDQQATRSGILNAIQKYRGTLTEDDSLLIYYGGHGFFDRDADKAYWLPVDAVDAYSPNRIIADDLTSDLRGLPARHILVISDSCYSGGLSRGAGEPLPLPSTPAYIGRQLRIRSRNLMSSGGNEPVADNGPGGHSVFAGAILNGLERDDNGPRFTATDFFYASVRRQVAANSEQIPEYMPLRNSSDDGGDFIFVRTGAPAANLAPPAEPAMGPIDAFRKGRDLFLRSQFSAALPLLLLSCNGGYANGCAAVGRMHTSGWGVTQDDPTAAEFNRRACDAGSGSGCAGLGEAYAKGRGVPQDVPQSQALYKKAAALTRNECDANDDMGCNSLAWLVYTGNGLAQNKAQSAALLRKACDVGNLDSCAALGNMYQGGDGISQNLKQAAGLYRKACDAGSLNNCAYLGQTYESGAGVEKDLNQALSLYRRACDGGEPLGCSDLGAMYATGNGVRKDEARAVTLYRQACDEGEPLGCSNLGAMYATGTAVGKDEAQGVRFFRKACDGDEPSGCTNLAIMYENGGGVTKDEAQAAVLFRKACDGGDPSACNDLGTLYENGAGVPPDKQQAISFYRQACHAGNDLGCQNLKRINP